MSQGSIGLAEPEVMFHYQIEAILIMLVIIDNYFECILVASLCHKLSSYCIIPAPPKNSQ